MEARKPKTSPAKKYRGFASRKGAIAGSWMVAIAATCFVANSDARLTHLTITERLPFAGGVEFGTTGTYERLKGTAFMEVDPRDPLNAVITDLDKAPRNARGMVEFSSPFLIIKPLDMAKGNHKIFSTVNNRGGDAKFMLEVHGAWHGQMQQQLAAQGKAILYISHVLEVVEQVCDRVIVIAKGRFLADAAPSELKTTLQLANLESVFAQLVEQQDTMVLAKELVEVMGVRHA